LIRLGQEEMGVEVARRSEYEAQFQAAQVKVVEAGAVVQEAQQA
jgi:hypothetical protein